MIRTLVLGGLVLTALSFLASPGLGAEGAPTRTDLARAYLRFEEAYRAHPPSPDRTADLNRRFDRVTTRFLAGGLAGVIRELDDLTTEVRSDDPGAAEWAAHLPLAIRAEPPVLVPGRDEQVTLTGFPLYEVPAGIERVRVRVRSRDGRPPLDLTVPFPSFSKVIARTLLGEEPGTFDILLRPAAGPPIPAGRIVVASRSLDTVREENAALLATVHPDDAESLQALASARARNEFLRDRPSRARIGDVVTDPVLLAAELEQEIAAIRGGRNPYRRKLGRTRRELDTGDLSMPFLVHAPAAAAGEEALPLVVALHGAGGDENMFLFGYGAGRIAELAEERGFVVATPNTHRISGREDFFPVLLDTLSREYRIDADRVYVLGHSLGALAAGRLAGRHPDRIAAAALLAGGAVWGRGDPAPGPPLLFVTGALDPLSGFAGPVEESPPARYHWRLANHGHTLLVADRLPDTIDWLLARSRKTR